LRLDTQLNDEQRDYLPDFTSSRGVSATLLNDILDFSKIEAGELGLENINFGFGVHCGRYSLYALAKRAQDKGLEMACLIHSRSYLRPVCGRPRSSASNIGKLVGNAIKLTHQGEIVIRAEPFQESKTLCHRALLGAGYGYWSHASGWARSLIASTQADGSTTRKYGGTG